MSMIDERFAKAQYLMAAAHDFWDACRNAGSAAGVQWVQGTQGELIIFTRGEYREQLLKNILPVTPEHYFGEQMPEAERLSRDGNYPYMKEQIMADEQYPQEQDKPNFFERLIDRVDDIDLGQTLDDIDRAAETIARVAALLRRLR